MNRTLIPLITVVMMGACLSAPAFNLATDKVQYVVAQAHLDDQWYNTWASTIASNIPNTMKMNFALIEKYPEYVFNFEGAIRYMVMKQTYPADYARVKAYVAKGQWYPAGAMLELPDVNVPSPESILRQILYGNGFFLEEFGITAKDVFLTDCFGFSAALPTMAAHCGLLGFSTNKGGMEGGFTGPATSVGVWQGPDGGSLVANYHPYGYKDGWWIATNEIGTLGQQTGVYANYGVYGTGDGGGAPPEDQIAAVCARVRLNATQDIKLASAASDQFYRDLTAAQIARFPVYKGELLMTLHGTGTYTAWSKLKLANRRNELLAQAAENASVVAELVGKLAYPAASLKQAWIRLLKRQMHDDITGTGGVTGYQDSFKDQDSTRAQFAGLLVTAQTRLADSLDTRVTGIPVVVFNPLSLDREDIVEMSVDFGAAAPAFVRVYDPDGNEVAAQVVSTSGNRDSILFIARVPPLGFKVFDVRPSTTASPVSTGITATTGGLQNNRYTVTVNGNGDISSILDRINSRELLSRPSQIQLLNDGPISTYPAWNIRYQDITATPSATVAGGLQTSVVENGPVRVVLKVTRTTSGSTFNQFISLCAGGAADRVAVANQYNWQTRSTLAKAAFPLSVSNPTATYDVGIGTIARGTNTAQKYEVVAQQWADITNTTADYGVAILSDYKYGWDKPDANTLRLTLLHTPNATGSGYTDQANIDIGNGSLFTYAFYGHTGTWAAGDVVSQAERFNQKLTAMQVQQHAGTRGKTFSFLTTSGPQIQVMALKRAERSDAYVVRVRETRGESLQNAQIAFANQIISAKEVNGFEEEKGTVQTGGNKISFNITPYQPRTFMVQFGTPVAVGQAGSGLHVNRPCLVTVRLPGARATPVTVKASFADGESPVLASLVNGKGQILCVTVIGTDGLVSFGAGASRLANGVYTLRLKTGSRVISTALTLIR